MAVYGVRWYGSRPYGDGASAAVAQGAGAFSWVATGDIAATGGASAVPEAIFGWTVTGDIAATVSASANGSFSWTVTGDVNAVVLTDDGFGLGDPSIRPPSEIIWIYDLTGAQVASIGPYIMRGPGLDGLEYEARAQERETLKWSMQASDPKYAHVAVDRTIRWRGIYFYITAVVPTGDGPKAWVDVEATALWAKLGDVSIDQDTAFTAVQVLPGLATLLDGTGWDYVVPETATGTYTMLAGSASVLALVREWAKITLHEVVFHTATRTVEFVDQQGIDRGIAFRYGKNLNSVKARIEPPVATVLIMTGADASLVSTQEDFTYYTDQGLTLPEAEASYTRTFRLTDASFRSQAELDAAAVARMAILAQPKVTYELNVADLSRITGHPEDDFYVGDQVRARHPTLGIDVYARVVRIVRRPFEPTKNIVELSTLPIDVSQGVPSPATTTTSDDWTLIKHDSPIALTIDTTTPVAPLNWIDVTFVNGEAVFGYQLDGTAAGSGTITLTVYNVETGNPLIPAVQRQYVSGVFHEVISFALQHITG